MARIRTIKPDALQHRKVGKLSDRAFRVWVGLLTQADDEGRLPCETDQVAAWVFGYQRQVKNEQVEEAIQEIASTNLIGIYQSNGTRYAYFPSWKDHQRINRPQPSTLPDPSTDNHVLFIEHSLNGVGSFTGEGKGMEGKGEDRKGRESEGNQQPPPTPPKGGIPYQEILDDLNGRIGKRFRSIPSTQKLISARWKEGFRLEDFKKVHANMVEEWGLDEKMKPYLRPITLYSPKFDSYLNREPAPNPRAEEEEQRRIAREYREAQRDERKRRQELAAESSDKAIDTEG